MIDQEQGVLVCHILLYEVFNKWYKRKDALWGDGNPNGKKE